VPLWNSSDQIDWLTFADFYHEKRIQCGLIRAMLDAGGDAPLAGKEAAQRFELQIQLRYRVNGDSKWLGFLFMQSPTTVHPQRIDIATGLEEDSCAVSGVVTKNIGCSGVLFRGEHLAEQSSPVEISLVVPNEMIKQRAAEVFCRGAVT